MPRSLAYLTKTIAFIRLFPTVSSFTDPQVFYQAKTLATLFKFILIFPQCELFHVSLGMIRLKHLSHCLHS